MHYCSKYVTGARPRLLPPRGQLHWGIRRASRTPGSRRKSLVNAFWGGRGSLITVKTVKRRTPTQNQDRLVNISVGGLGGVGTRCAGWAGWVERCTILYANEEKQGKKGRPTLTKRQRKPERPKSSGNRVVGGGGGPYLGLICPLPHRRRA